MEKIVEDFIREKEFPFEIRIMENKGKAWVGDIHYHFNFSVDGVWYELEDSKTYRENSWALYRRAPERLNI